MRASLELYRYTTAVNDTYWLEIDKMYSAFSPGKESNRFLD